MIFKQTKLTILTLATASFLISTNSFAQSIQWTTAEGGNNDWFTSVVVPNGIGWDAANAAATTETSYLATPVTQAEVNFIYNNLVAPTAIPSQNVAYWLGVSSPEISQPWTFVTGETVVFQNNTWPWYLPTYNGSTDIKSNIQTYIDWAEGQNTPQGIALFAPNNIWHPNSSLMDWTKSGSAVGYIVESSAALAITTPVPEPEEWAMMLLGLPLMGFVARRKKANVMLSA